MEQNLEDLKKEFAQAIESVTDRSALANLKADYLGKKGKLNAILKSLKDASPDVKKSLGMKSNQLKEEILAEVDQKMTQLETAEINEKLLKNWQDVSFRNSIRDQGLNAAGFHPVSLIQRELEEIFQSMGFSILDGPHIENEYYNFEALNIPASHPARDMQDTFWFTDKKHLLRTHTSNMQIRGMEIHKPPFKFVGAGKVFRCETLDASHEAAVPPDGRDDGG